MVTLIFIIASFLIVVIYDIIALVKGWRTITSWFRQWLLSEEKGLPVIAYAMGALTGHFTLYIDFSFIPGIVALIFFILHSLFVIIWTIKNEYQLRNDPDDVSKIYFWLKNKWYITGAVGSVIGCLWWL